MIESCSAKRMLASIIFLGGLTFLILVLESSWTNGTHQPFTVPSNRTDFTCWFTEEYKIVKECQPCSDFEIKSETNDACKETKYKEEVQCISGIKVYRSCPRVGWLEESKFWKFEGIIFVLSLISTCTVFLRQRVLDRKVMLRIQKQLANSA